MTDDMLRVMLFLHRRVDWSTGAVHRMCAKTIREQAWFKGATRPSLATVQRVLLVLESCGWIVLPSEYHYSENYTILLCNFEAVVEDAPAEGVVILRPRNVLPYREGKKKLRGLMRDHLRNRCGTREEHVRNTRGTDAPRTSAAPPKGDGREDGDLRSGKPKRTGHLPDNVTVGEVVETFDDAAPRHPPQPAFASPVPRPVEPPKAKPYDTWDDPGLYMLFMDRECPSIRDDKVKRRLWFQLRKTEYKQKFEDFLAGKQTSADMVLETNVMATDAPVETIEELD